MKALQKFTPEYLETCSKMSISQILHFLHDFAKLQQSRKSKSKLISLRVDEDLLRAFKEKAKRKNIKYQTKIKELMEDYLLS